MCVRKLLVFYMVLLGGYIMSRFEVVRIKERIMDQKI